MDKTKLNLERLRAYDVEWEEQKHPRAENGQFTSGSGSAGGRSGSGNKYGYSDQDDYEFKHGEIKSPLHQAAETIQGESKWEHKQNIKLMEGLEKAEKNEKHQIVISWIVHNLRQGMSAKEAFAKADQYVRTGRFSGRPFAPESLRKWWENWSYKWGPQEEEG